ncbi:hypothetical protein [Geminocystis herdmanii]|uniref:hypothetical protein n=1 Tax=Geminocystis herdmanii TaxID=669359 RepID=UPI000348076E|nr:hypothetical protein [Geminocystis herdmanii]
MKIFFLMVFGLSTLLVGCDRATLDGLNLKVNADIKSGYDKESEEANKDQSSETSIEMTDKTPSEMAESLTKAVQKTIETKKETQSTEKVAENKPVSENNVKNDADEPMPFKEIAQCSKAGITAKTNEIFYADNSNVKSIDSKNEKQVKAWKKIYSQVEQECNK